MPPLLRMGQFHSCKGGSMGQGVIRRINSALAAEHSADAGNPPARQRRIAQSMGYALADGAAATVAAPPSITANSFDLI